MAQHNSVQRIISWKPSQQVAYRGVVASRLYAHPHTTKFSVYIATSPDAFIARSDGYIGWVQHAHGEVGTRVFRAWRYKVD